MKRIKEKLKCIWHIIKDKEYVVFTGTSKNKRVSSTCAITSDNISVPFLRSASETLFKVESKLPNSKRYYFVSYEAFRGGEMVRTGNTAIICDSGRLKTKRFSCLVLEQINNLYKQNADFLRVDFIKEISAQQYFNGIF